MSYASHTVGARPARRTEFRHSERLVTVLGACAFGAMMGFGIAVATGRADMWFLFFAMAVVLTIALYPASANMADAAVTHSPGCRFAARLHLASLLAWPVAAQLAGSFYWTVPLAALLSLFMLASCWRGGAHVVYRIGLQGIIVAALAADQGAARLMGS